MLCRSQLISCLALLVGLVIFGGCQPVQLSPSQLQVLQNKLEIGCYPEPLSQLEQVVQKHTLQLDVIRLYIKTAFRCDFTELLEDRFASDSLVHVYARALLAAGRHDYSNAIDLLKQAIHKKPNLAELHYRLGIIFLEQQQYPKAVHSLLQASELGIKDKRLVLRLVQAEIGNNDFKAVNKRLKQFVMGNVSRDLLQKAIDLSMYAIAKRRNLPEQANSTLQVLLNNILRQQIITQGELGDIEQALKQWPDVAAFYTLKGIFYLRSQQDALAANAFTRAIELSPWDPFPVLTFGEFLLENGNASTALEYLQQAISLNPLDIKAYLLLLKTAKQLSLPQIQKEALLMLAVLEPNDVTHRLALGALAQNVGDLTKAERYYRQTLKAEKTNLAALYGLALIYWEKSQSLPNKGDRASAQDKAKQLVKELLELAPNHVAGLNLKKKIEDLQQ